MFKFLKIKSIEEKSIEERYIDLSMDIDKKVYHIFDIKSNYNRGEYKSMYLDISILGMSAKKIYSADGYDDLFVEFEEKTNTHFIYRYMSMSDRFQIYKALKQQL